MPLGVRTCCKVSRNMTVNCFFLLQEQDLEVATSLQVNVEKRM